MKSEHDSARWVEVLSTFDEIVEESEPERRTRLAAIGSRDPELRSAIEALLAADAQADERLARLETALGSGDARHSNEGRHADALNLVGRLVSHFRVVEPLAQGGMGIVYRAEDTRLGRAVALKFPLTADQLDRRAKERFVHEAQLAGALDHPNLCAIYEAGETEDGHLFHAMPLYAGETLKARLARDGALPIPEALGIAKQIAHGLSAAHGAGIVHRDLKPANVMLLPDGTVKLLDFGLARAKDLSLTASRTALGTVSYMAPEQILGRSLDGRTDLWALGVVLYEMLTGARPFAGEEAMSVAHAIVHTEPLLASSLRTDIPAEVEGVVRTLLSKDPARRYSSAKDVATALAVIQVGKPGAAAVPALANVTRWHHRAWARPATLAVLIAVALGVGAWLASRNANSSSVPRTVAVLPFDDLSGDSKHIAVGMSDAIATELSRLQGLIVPSPASMAAHRGKAGASTELAAAPGASAIVTGTVRRVDNRVQLDLQLVDARSNRRLWSDRYDRAATELAAVQRDAARTIVAALRLRTTDAEAARLDRPLTTSAQAYERYLRGREVELRSASREFGANIPTENIRTMVSLYTQARDADPAFAVARGRLAIALMNAAETYDTTQARREQARLEAESALRLEPKLSEAHHALASYWSANGRDVGKAIAELQAALDDSPNNAGLSVSLATAFLFAGRWDEVIVALERAMRLDPRHPTAPMMAALTYLRLRRDEEAMRAFDRAFELAPNDHMIRVLKGHTYLRWKGTPDTLAAVLERVPANWDPAGMTTWARYTVLRVQRRYADALAMLDASGSALSRDGLVYQPTALMRAQCYEALGDRPKARSYYEVARAMLADSVARRPNNGSIRVVLGLVYASLGRKEEAVREARRAMELAPPGHPAASAFMGVAVEVFARAGDFDAAFELLELLFAMPAGREVTIQYLRLWPGFDPLRADPRFDQLLARFGQG